MGHASQQSAKYSKHVVYLMGTQEDRTCILIHTGGVVAEVKVEQVTGEMRNWGQRNLTPCLK